MTAPRMMVLTKSRWSRLLSGGVQAMCDAPDHLGTNETTARTNTIKCCIKLACGPGQPQQQPRTNGQQADLICASCGFEKPRLFWHAFLPASFSLGLVLFRRFAAIAATLGWGGRKVDSCRGLWACPTDHVWRLPCLVDQPSFFRCQTWFSKWANVGTRTASTACVAIRLWEIGVAMMVYNLLRSRFSSILVSLQVLPPFSAAR